MTSTLGIEARSHEAKINNEKERITLRITIITVDRQVCDD